jgi:hypothetical protein
MVTGIDVPRLQVDGTRDGRLQVEGTKDERTKGTDGWNIGMDATHLGFRRMVPGMDAPRLQVDGTIGMDAPRVQEDGTDMDGPLIQVAGTRDDRGGW